jgi:hypothetical protein
MENEFGANPSPNGRGICPEFIFHFGQAGQSLRLYLQ